GAARGRRGLIFGLVSGGVLSGLVFVRRRCPPSLCVCAPSIHTWGEMSKRLRSAPEQQHSQRVPIAHVPAPVLPPPLRHLRRHPQVHGLQVILRLEVVQERRPVLQRRRQVIQVVPVEQRPLQVRQGPQERHHLLVVVRRQVARTVV